MIFRNRYSRWPSGSSSFISSVASPPHHCLSAVVANEQFRCDRHSAVGATTDKCLCFCWSNPPGARVLCQIQWSCVGRSEFDTTDSWRMLMGSPHFQATGIMGQLSRASQAPQD
ncbi:hypothetical protein BDV24DRAFT_91552 [Aspergillus arachidicola]|uniref:Uncharacterized protein n=1 Tax=Aspergillus arachidicola TaxID=656916 RepID=A0A5N6YMD5_9EURO|nr:hypothetical protein BDV24DRAFT_91552 [Aspergillus arachidicola]